MTINRRRRQGKFALGKPTLGKFVLARHLTGAPARRVRFWFGGRLLLRTGEYEHTAATGRIENIGQNAEPGIVFRKPAKTVADTSADQRPLIEEEIGKRSNRGNPGPAAALAQNMHAHLPAKDDEIRADPEHARRCMNH